MSRSFPVTPPIRRSPNPCFARWPIGPRAQRRCYAGDGAVARQTWESFSKNWNTDVKATFHWIQSALRLPLEHGSRVLISSSGAAIEGSPLSGGYAGAKRMIWLMAGYANGVADDLNLGIRFQALLLRQIVGSTELGRAAAEAYARRKGVS